MKKFGRNMMTGNILLLLGVLQTLPISQALYEDQVGKFDW